MDAPDNPDPTLEAQEDVAEEQVLAQLQTRMDAALSSWENANMDQLDTQYELVQKILEQMSRDKVLTVQDTEAADELAQTLYAVRMGQSLEVSGLTPTTVSEQVHAWIQHATQVKEAEIEQAADEHKDLLVQPEQDVARPAAEAPPPKPMSKESKHRQEQGRTFRAP